MAGDRAAVEQPALGRTRLVPGGRDQAGTGTPLIAALTTTTGQGAFRRQARATGPMSTMAGLFDAPLRDVAGLVQALADQRSGAA